LYQGGSAGNADVLVGCFSGTADEDVGVSGRRDSYAATLTDWKGGNACHTQTANFLFSLA
jgi:hypothetical protein